MGRPRIIASIEARMGSSRLPGKVLRDVCGAPALSRLLARLRRCRSVDDIVLATTITPADDALVAWAQHADCRFFRGSESDVLDRVVRAHQMMGSDVVVEITGDCVLTDPETVDLGVETFLANSKICDVVSNCGSNFVPSYPMGDSVQVFPLRLLAEVNVSSRDPAVHEHVSLHFYDHPDRYRLMNLVAPRRWEGADIRLQLDYPEDLIFINEVWRRLWPVYGDSFGTEEIMQLLRREPELALINKHCEERAVR